MQYESDSTKNPGKVGYEEFKSNNNFSLKYNINPSLTIGLSYREVTMAQLALHTKRAYKNQLNHLIKKMKTLKKIQINLMHLENH